MTKQELENYENLQDLFYIRCETICDILRPLNSAYNFVDSVRISGDLVICEGTEYWSYGGEQDYYANFPKEYLYMDDKDIQKIVDDELKKRVEAESHRKALDEKKKTEKEKAEYERLKKIYG